MTYEEEKKKWEVDRENYVPVVRKQILDQLKDLQDKLVNDEDFPHGKQDIDALIGIHDRIEECLNNWYY